MALPNAASRVILCGPGPPDDIEAEMLDIIADLASDNRRPSGLIKLTGALKVEVAPPLSIQDAPTGLP